jgi:hypothetical protein
MEMMRTGLAVVAAIGSLAAAGCGGGSSGGSAAQSTAAPAATSAATTAAPVATTTVATAPATAGGLTPIGSALQMGQPAVVSYTDDTTHKTSNVEVTPEKIEQGTLDDFKNIQLDANQKTSTPFYVPLHVKNVGTGDLSGSNPGEFIDGVDDRGQFQSDVIFIGSFDRCASADPKHFKPGESYDTCLTYLIPKGGSIVGMRWSAFDQKTGKSDITWK